MRSYVTDFHPRDSQILYEIGKNLQHLWSIRDFKQAVIVCEKQHNYIIEIEEKLPKNIRYHKGDVFYNWGISLISQRKEEIEFLGVNKFVLAYIEDLFDHDSFEIANNLPAARVLKSLYSEIISYLAEIQVIVESHIKRDSIPKDPFEIIRSIGDESFQRLRSLFRFRPVDQATEGEKANIKVFIIHGRNVKAKIAMDEFLESLGLEVISWMEMIAETGNPNAYLHEIIRKGFDLAQAVVALMTPDDKGMLRDELWGKNEDEEEVKLTDRPRQNVIYEAGMAMIIQPKRTVLVELGKSRLPSDLGGMHTVRLNNTKERRKALADKLMIAGCKVNFEDDEWHTAGDFDEAINFDAIPDETT